MNQVIRWNDIEHESLLRLFSQVRVHSEKTSTREQYPSYTQAVPLAHVCTIPRTLVYYPSHTGVLPLFEDREYDVALNLYCIKAVVLAVAEVGSQDCSFTWISFKAIFLQNCLLCQQESCVSVNIHCRVMLELFPVPMYV